jgi:hypothetical protein
MAESGQQKPVACVRVPSEDIRNIIAEELFKPEGGPMAWALKHLKIALDESPDVDLELPLMFESLRRLETTKLWVIKEALEQFFVERGDILKDFEELVGLGGECAKGDELARISYRSALRLYNELNKQGPESVLYEKVCRWNSNAKELEASNSGEAEFTCLEDLRLLACRHVLSEHIRLSLILDGMPPASEQAQ